MPFNTGLGSRLLAPGLNEVMWQAYNVRPKEYPDIFNVKNSKRNYEEVLEIIGQGAMPVKNEGESVSYSLIRQGEIKRYTHVEFGLGNRVTQTMLEDDLYGVTRAQKLASELGKAALLTEEVRAANVFNNGFTVADGFPKNGTQSVLFSATHSLLGTGGTYSNTASADLAQASLEAAIISFHKLVGENGEPIIIIPRKLLIPPDLIMVARELLGSEYKPYTANNEINPTREDRLDMKVNHYLTDADSWFVGADKSDHTLTFWWRRKLEYKADTDFDSGDMKQKATERFSVGWHDWRGWYGGLGV